MHSARHSENAGGIAKFNRADQMAAKNLFGYSCRLFAQIYPSACLSYVKCDQWMDLYCSHMEKCWFTHSKYYVVFVTVTIRKIGK